MKGSELHPTPVKQMNIDLGITLLENDYDAIKPIQKRDPPPIMKDDFNEVIMN